MSDILKLMQDPTVATALAWVDAHVGQVVEEAIRVCEIPAPTFEEGDRAAYVKERFARLGLQDVLIDGAGNVRGRRPGTGSAPGSPSGPTWTRCSQRAPTSG